MEAPQSPENSYARKLLKKQSRNESSPKRNMPESKRNRPELKRNKPELNRNKAETKITLNETGPKHKTKQTKFLTEINPKRK